MQFFHTLSFILIIAVITRLVHGEAFTWPKANLKINFGHSNTVPGFFRFQETFVTSPDYQVSSNDINELAEYSDRIWAPKKLSYVLDVTDYGFKSIDLKLGFSETDEAFCSKAARVFDVTAGEKTISKVDIFDLAGCKQPHDLIFQGISSHTPINITLTSVTRNPILSNLVVRESGLGATLPRRQVAPNSVPVTKPASTTGFVTTTKPASTTGFVTTTKPASTTGFVTTTKSASTTGFVTTTKPASTTGFATTTKSASTTTKPASTTGFVTTTKSASTTGLVTTTKSASTTGLVTTTKSASTTGFATTTRPAPVENSNNTRPSLSDISFPSTFPPFTTRPASETKPASVTDPVLTTKSAPIDNSNTTRPSLSDISFPSTYPPYTTRPAPVTNSTPVTKPAPTEKSNTTRPSFSDISFPSTLPNISFPSTLPPSIATTVRQTSVSAVIDVTKTVAVIDAGSDTGITGTKSFKSGGAKITGTVRPTKYKSLRYGKKFSYRFKGSGIYAIELGFAEIDPTYCDDKASRVFSVSLNDEEPKELQGLDVKAKTGCNKAFIWNSGDFEIGGNLEITFTASSGEAMVSSIIVRKLLRNCVPESKESSSDTFDHVSHSVPGDYPPKTSSLTAYPDVDGNGFEPVKIDGSGSHSHYFDAVNSITGRIIDFEWTSPKTKEFLSEKSNFPMDFFIGTTTLNLKVVDNICDSDTAETIVRVAKPGEAEPDAKTPNIRDLFPTEAGTEGEGFASVRVIDVRPELQPDSVSIMGKEVKITRFDPVSAIIEFTIPPADVIETVAVVVNWADGTKSNELFLTYVAKKMDEPVAFNEQGLDVGDDNGILASCVKVGADGNVYMGTLSGVVVRLTYNLDDLKLTKRCQSKPIRDSKFKDSKGQVSQRDILGLAFDPRDKFPRPYVSTSTLFWKKRISGENKAGWRNGAIDRLAQGSDPSDPNICLVYDKRIVSNLPVSNLDHSINGLEFTQNGDLLINIGGSTNLGLPGDRLGNLWDAPNQAGTFLAKLSKGEFFNGEITYSQDTNFHLGKQTGGDLQIVADGLRNPFGLVLHSSGRLYASENGPNAGFGNAAISCDDADIGLGPGDDFPEVWPGNIKVGDGQNQYSVSRPDKIVHIDLGKVGYYGHPNFQRGQCRWIDPSDNKDGKDGAPPSNYVPPIAIMTSSAAGLCEYHAESVFGGALKDRLIVSRYKGGYTRFLPAVAAGSPRVNGRDITKTGGVAITMNAAGDIIIAQINDKKVVALRPKVPKLRSLSRTTIIAATPYRHGAGGGTTLTIGGLNFGKDSATVKVGGKDCEIKSQTDTVITCIVPKAEKPGSLVNMVIVSAGMMRAKMDKAVWYMNV